MKKSTRFMTSLLVLVCMYLISAATFPALQQQEDNPNPPNQPVKLIFIHHSTGANWLADGYGDLGRTLDQNNYFVSDTNYGWGPDGLGDRTDIPNWIEWFRSEGTPTYMEALYNENRQKAGYTRTLSDPGGENQVILFKSCFPNSALGGNPDDPPGSYEDMTVGGAKYVYNQILQYFATRPDKLFIVITAPPLTDPTYAENARAFNQWLVEDWLSENQYTLNNVAVFDFYNVLTSPDAHHRYQEGNIEHTIGGSNTLHYPSGDDHPSQEGSQKATDEFIPLLNVFYHRWQAEAPSSPPANEPLQSEPDEDETVESPPALSALITGLIDDFEAGPPAGTNGWEAFWDEATQTTLRCHMCSSTNYSGSKSFKLDFDIDPGSWGTCALFYDQAQNWGGSPGISFYLLAAQAGTVLDINLYVEGPEGRESYITQFETTPASMEEWVPVTLNWDQFVRVDWEDGAGTPFGKPEQVSGMAFGFNAYAEVSTYGTIWVDELRLAGSQLSEEAVELPEPTREPAAEPEEVPAEKPGGGFPCFSALALPLGLVGLALYRRQN